VWPGQKRFDAIIRFDKAVELEPIVHAAAMFVERRFDPRFDAREPDTRLDCAINATGRWCLRAACMCRSRVCRTGRFRLRSTRRSGCSLLHSLTWTSTGPIRAGRCDAERLAEETSRGHPVDHAHGDAVALQFGAKQQTDGTSADNQHIHVFHVPLLTVHRALKSNRGELSRKPKKNRR
jgi:hypothetical protein